MSKPHLSLVPFLALLASTLLLPATGAAQPYPFSVNAIGGVAGGFDVEPDAGVGNLGFQLGFSWATQANTRAGFRLGRLDFSGETLGALRDGDLTYLTVGGEYRFSEAFYDSGLFFGIGGYRLEGRRGGAREDDTSLGLHVGVSGEFPVNRRFAVLVELSGHYADLDHVQLFGSALGGVAFRF